MTENVDTKALEAVVSTSRAITAGKSKASLADMMSMLSPAAPAGSKDRQPPVPVPLTDAQKVALEMLPKIFGKTVVVADRTLSSKEIETLVVERDTIDTVVSALSARKDGSIREVLANHFDNILTEAQKAEAPQDSKGHYAVKQEVAADGVGRKVQRIVSGGKPRLTVEAVETLLESGQIDRKTYLALTKVPPTPRVLDEDGVHKAIQKDPSLFFLLASVAEPTNPTTTIKVANL